MTDQYYETPLLRPDSPLDDRSKSLIREIYAIEKAKALALPTDDPMDPKRLARVKFTWKEIWEQPEIITNNLDLEKESVAEAAACIASKSIDRIYMTGCGDSIASLLAVRSFFEELLGIPCEAIQALDFTYYYNRPITDRTLVITLSSSGATVRTVEAMLLARSKGANTLTLSNTPGSPLMRESTRLYQLGIDIARRRGYSSEMLDGYQSLLLQTPKLIEKVLAEHNEKIIEVSEAEAERHVYLYSGGGPAFASTLIGAAKIKECTPDHAIAIPLEEYHHYNSQKAGDPMFLTAPNGPSVPRALDTAREGQRWGGQVYSIVSDGDHTLDLDSNCVFTLPKMNELLSPLVYTVPVQLFAYHVAMSKFRRAGALE
jgi:glucosamine--fructose-6-phosphate aminotransferase (isomerizing)